MNFVKQTQILLSASLIAVSGLMFKPLSAHAAGDFRGYPFIATASENMGDFKSEIVVSGKGHPVVVDPGKESPTGSYAGIVITPPKGFKGLNTISFLTTGSTKGAATPTVVIEHINPGDRYREVYLPSSVADAVGPKDKDGFSEVTFNRCGVSEDALVEKIIVTYNGRPAKFLVDDIKINGQEVELQLTSGTQFYKVTNGSKTGPIGELGAPVAAKTVKANKTLTSKAQTRQGGRTELKVTNGSGEAIVVYMTLGVPPNCVTDVHQIPFITSFNNAHQGSFSLAPGASVTYTPPGNMGISGNFSFGSTPQNCPPPEYPNGVTLAEFITNNGFQGPGAQETLDISTVDGCNAKVRYSLSGGGTWNAGGNRNNITTFENAGLYENVGRVGVFPYGCDNCKTSDNPPKCANQPPKKGCQPEHMCNVQRNAQDLSGGTIQITYLGMIK